MALLYLKLIAIRKVVIESWAFRGVLRSPRELIIQEANLQRIPTNAFTGLSNLKHIWFRNCTITSIAANAFEYLSNVEYIYFRDSTIVQLDNFAFSKSVIFFNVFLSYMVETAAVEAEQMHKSKHCISECCDLLSIVYIVDQSFCFDFLSQFFILA